jgi:hypothetical protein
MTWGDKGGLNVKSIDFVEQAFNQPFDGIFGCAIGTEARDTECAGG